MTMHTDEGINPPTEQTDPLAAVRDLTRMIDRESWLSTNIRCIDPSEKRVLYSNCRLEGYGHPTLNIINRPTWI